MKTHCFTALACMAAVSTSYAATIQLTNGNFNDQATSAPGWTSTGVTNANYFANNITAAQLSAYGTIGFIKSAGANYIQQGITTSDAGAMNATTFGAYTINFDLGYRRDSGTNGDLNLRVALWDTTANTELAGQTFTLINPGTGTNSLSAQVASLNYNNSAPALSGHGIALRITSMDANLGTNAWQRTAMVDNFVVTAVPEPGAALLGGLGLLAMLRRRRA